MTMMALGPYRFALSTAAYQSLTRTASFRWADQERIGRVSAAQYTGSDLQTLELDGIIYPGFRGGVGQVELMRRMAGLGIPLPLVSGGGLIFGRWVIEEVRETGTVFTKNGAPRKIEFGLRLKQYGEDGLWRFFT
jgi:uncharacterized protein